MKVSYWKFLTVILEENEIWQIVQPKVENTLTHFSALGNPETTDFENLHQSSTPNKNGTSSTSILSNGITKHASIESIPKAEVPANAIKNMKNV